MGEKVLVVYYSFEGNTRFIAECIADEVGADMMELKPLKEPKSHGFTKYLWGGRQVVMKEKPKLKPLEKDPQAYDTVFLGTPVWAFSYTPAVRTFIRMDLLRGKKVALFITHEGGPRNTLDSMAKAIDCREIVGMNDFPMVRDNRERECARARKWAREVLRWENI